MAFTFGKLLKPFFRLSADEFPKLAAARYGQNDDMDQTWLLFEPVASNLVGGFKTALDDDRFNVLVPRLDSVEGEFRGVAYEGAGMGLMLLDSLGPWKKRLQAFIDGPGAPYDWLLYIGAGLVLPRVPMHPDRFLAKLDPFLRWFVMDGYGFYEGFFSGERSVIKHRIPARVTGYGQRAFDHGLGRSIWFSTGANVDRIVSTISSFPRSRQADLWGGIGLACAYAACVVDRDAIRVLHKTAGPYGPAMAAGAAVAATYRMQTGGVAEQTDLACEVLCGLTSAEVAQIGNAERKSLPPDGVEPAYEIWRQSLARRFTSRPEENILETKEAKS
jgi:enediyne biosynthesis protein E3